MSLKLIPPTPGRNKVFRVRGTHHGVYLDRSTKTTSRTKAQKFLKTWEEQIECGELSSKPRLTFADAVLSYLQAGGDRRFIGRVLEHFGDKIAAEDIDQAAIDRAAVALYPERSPATRNRQVYAPVSAALNHSGVTLKIKRPKGAAGNPRRVWLRPEQFETLVRAALDIDVEFALLLVVLCYTGLRLSEGLRLECSAISLATQEAFVGRTKNGDPRLVHLPPRLVTAFANHPRGLNREGRVFRWRTSPHHLYVLASRAYGAAKIDDGGAPFHILRHTYGAWMTRAGADLVATGAWRSASAARVYQHFDVADEARKVELLPGAKRGLENENRKAG